MQRKVNKKFDTQIPREEYFSRKSLRKNNFLAMYQQINAIADINPKKILEIGIGNKSVSTILKNFGYDITTCDFDASLRPDYVADIRELPFKDNSFDAILACEILEHIPFKDVPKALGELRRITKKYVVISIPYACISFGGLFKLRVPFIGRFFDFVLYFPYDWLNPRRFKFNGEHYWEMGRKGYPKRKILRLLKKYFDVIKHYPELIQPEHYFFILKKK